MPFATSTHVVEGEIRTGGFLLFGHRICLKAMARLIGIGSSRLMRLRKAFLAGETCPLDGRTKRASVDGKKVDRNQSYKRELIHDFLNELWVQVSEPMPEVNANHGGRQQTNKALKFRSRKGKRPRRDKKRDDQLDEHGVQSLRLLPPGSYKEYLNLFLSKNPLVKVSYKLFTQVTGRFISYLYFCFGPWVGIGWLFWGTMCYLLRNEC